jgi:hypothetical protein
LPIPETWLDATATKRSAPPSRAAIPSTVTVEKRSDGDVLVNNGKVLTPAFLAIQSFDIHAERGEIAFSAKRKDSFDIGLVALEGSQVNWVPEETMDETDPRWALRGNKFAYVLRNPNGDLVRTIHVPTSFQLTVDFPNGVINDVTWDAESERISVAYETPDASEGVETVKYSGEGRQRTVAPAVRLAHQLEPFGNDTLLLRPAELRYEEKAPLVVWITAGRLNAWSDARAALLKDAPIALIVTTRVPDADFWDRVRGTAWIDTSRTFIVNASSRVTNLPPGAVTISGAADVPSGRYRRRGAAVTVAPAVVESIAAGLIRKELRIEN